MNVRELIEILHDLNGDTKIQVVNRACGGGADLLTAEPVKDSDELVLTFLDNNFMSQIEARYRTFSFTGVDRMGQFVTGRASADVAMSSLTSIEKAVQKADRKIYK